ncbi:MAG: hypothetical protein IRZ15_09995 [Bryobacteraceae bacterium]|nr:hypothetical protein [Bryobacteraceae bacterium]
MTTKKVKAIFQLKVSLRDIEPSIWRLKCRGHTNAPGTTLPLKLTDREPELILKHSFAPDELTQQFPAYEVRPRQQ